MARVPYVTEDDVSEEYRDMLTSQLQPGEPLNLYAALGNNEALLAGMRSYFGAMWSESGLSEREREFVILAVADEADSDYEWHQHITIATNAGLTDTEISAIVTDDPVVLAEDEALLVEYARAAVRGSVTDDLHDRLAARYDDSTVVAIATIAGSYLGLARFIDALDIEVED
jgi:alkylhydroperoxidase family enzyme